MRIPVLTPLAQALGLGDRARRRRAEPARCAPRQRARRAARTVGLAGGTAAVLVALAVAVFPTRVWLDQRSDIAQAEQRLAVLRTQNEAFEARLERLDDDEEIERLAREQYNLVMPGEEAYAILPAPLPPLEPLEVWPFGPLIGD